MTETRSRPDRKQLPCPVLSPHRVVALCLVALFAAIAGEGVCAQIIRPASTTSRPSQLKRFRFIWGGGTPQIWQGRVTVIGGQLKQIIPLGLSADAGGTTMPVDNQVWVGAIQATDFAGFDIDVVGDAGTVLDIEFHNASQPGASIQQSVALQQLIIDESSGGSYQIKLDDQARMEISRAPGDRLRVEIDRPHLVFDPGEPLEFSLRPIQTPPNMESSNRLLVELKTARSHQSLWSHQWELRREADQLLLDGRISVPLPADEGVYEIELSLVDNHLTSRLNLKRPSMLRAIQVVVVNPRSAVESNVQLWREVATIDPATTDWRDKLPSLPNFRLSSWSSSPLKNEGASTRAFRDRQLTALQPGGWQAIPLAVEQIGQPHIIEIEYLDEGPMSLGISILQPDQQGQVQSFGADSGIQIHSRVTDAEPQLRRHRIFVWPNGSPQYLLLANRHATVSAAVGRIKIMAGPPRLASPGTSNPAAGRDYLAFYEKPLFADNFSAEKSLDPQTGQLIDDWHSFLTGAQRWTQYLKANGYTGAMLLVAGDGSALYPSDRLQPSPRFDSGVFSSVGKDPMRKDILEMLLRVFQRERLQLVPVLHLNAPLPELERIRHAAESSTGIDLVNLRGRSLQSVFQESPQSISYYNLLDPRVQRATTAVVEELVERYQKHPAMGGVGLLYSKDSACVLPGQTWGMDASTIERFAKQTDLTAEWQQAGSEFMLQLLTSQRRGMWLDWRSQQMGGWLARVHAATQKLGTQKKLFVLGTDLFYTQDAFSALTPSLRRSSDLGEAAQRIALPIQAIKQNRDIVFLRPFEIAPENPLAMRRLDIHMQHSNQTSQLLAGDPTDGVLFSHRYAWAHFAELQKQKLFGQPQRQPLMRLQPLVPSDVWNRERFTASLRQDDCQYLVDGGWLTSFGQEEHLSQMIEVFTQLPQVNFESVDAGDSVSQGVVIRQANMGDSTFVYLVNPTPWAVSVTLDVGGSTANLVSLSQTDFEAKWEDGNRQIVIPLRPFDLAGLRSATPLTIDGYREEYPAGVAEELRSRLNELVTKVSRAENAEATDVLLNPGFEASPVPTRGGPDPGSSDHQFGWYFDPAQKQHISISRDRAHQGESALVMTSQGQEIWIRSNEFAAPVTGRLSIVAWMRTSDPEKPPPIRISIDGYDGRQRYYRYGQIGTARNAENADGRIEADWRQFAVHFDDLPPSGLRSLRVGFDLVGPGEVEIDDVQIFDRWLDADDSSAITQLLALAGYQLSPNQQNLDHCRRILEGYWPRFLQEFFPEPAAPPHSQQPPVDDGLVEENGQKSEEPRSSLFEQIKNDIFPKRR